MTERQVDAVEIVLPEVEMTEEDRFPDQLGRDQREAAKHDAPAPGPDPRRELRPVDDVPRLATALARDVRDRKSLRAALKLSAGLIHLSAGLIHGAQPNVGSGCFLLNSPRLGSAGSAANYVACNVTMTSGSSRSQASRSTSPAGPDDAASA